MRLATLSSTNLNALFRTTTNAPTTGIPIPSLPAFMTSSASDSPRVCVRSVLECNEIGRLLKKRAYATTSASSLTLMRSKHLHRPDFLTTTTIVANRDDIVEQAAYAFLLSEALRPGSAAFPLRLLLPSPRLPLQFPDLLFFDSLSPSTSLSASGFVSGSASASTSALTMAATPSSSPVPAPTLHGFRACCGEAARAN